MDHVPPEKMWPLLIFLVYMLWILLPEAIPSCAHDEDDLPVLTVDDVVLILLLLWLACF